MKPCKISPYAPTGDGYPQKYERATGKQRGHHRIVLERKLGRRIRPGLRALHHCDNRLCIEPTHLYEGTQRQNMLDKQRRGRCAVGLSNGNARYSDATIEAIRLATGTQQAIADRFGCSQTYVGAIKRCEVRVK